MSPPTPEGRRLLGLVFQSIRGGDVTPAAFPSAAPQDVATLVRMAERTPVSVSSASASPQTAVRVLEVALARAEEIARAERRPLGAVLFGDFEALDPENARSLAALQSILADAARRKRARTWRTGFLGALAGAALAAGGVTLLSVYAHVTLL